MQALPSLGRRLLRRTGDPARPAPGRKRLAGYFFAAWPLTSSQILLKATSWFFRNDA